MWLPTWQWAEEHRHRGHKSAWIDSVRSLGCNGCRATRGRNELLPGLPRIAPTAPASSEGCNFWAAPTSTWKPTSFCRVFRPPTTVTAADDGFVAAVPARAPTVTKAPPSALADAALAAFSVRPVIAAKVSVTVALRLMWRVPSTIFCTFSTEPDDSLMPIKLGCSASSTTTSAGMSYPVACGKL